MVKKFDYFIEPEQGIKYGVLKGVYGAPCTVFIKLPPKIDCYGYKRMYFRFAQCFAERGFNVICAENHGDDVSERYDLEVLKKFPNSYFNFVGVGSGATYGLTDLSRRVNLNKMLLINMPLSNNLGEVIDMLSGIDRKRTAFAYGDKDPSYRYTPLLKRMYFDVTAVDGADHSFKDKASSFVLLASKMTN